MMQLKSEVDATHNFYWYEDPTAELIHLIPWDLDNAFDNITGPANPVTPIKINGVRRLTTVNLSRTAGGG